MWRTVVYGLWLGLLWMGCTHERVEPLCPEPVVQADLDEGGTGAPLAYETGFLPLLASQALRRELWTFYGEVEPVARRFAPWGWTEIRLVIASDRALWWEHGLIEVPVAADDQGALAHELFHGAFHRSPLHAGRDEEWGEGFADAFRYLVERELLGGDASPWRRKMDRLAAMTPDERLVARREDDTVRFYSHPALVILERAGWNLARFEALWFELNEQRRTAGRDILRDEFGDVFAQAPCARGGDETSCSLAPTGTDISRGAATRVP